MEPRIVPPVEQVYEVTAVLVGPNEFEFSGDVVWDPVQQKHLIPVRVPSQIALVLKNATFQKDPLFWKQKDCAPFISEVLVDPNLTRIEIRTGCDAHRVGAFRINYVDPNGHPRTGGDPTIINADTPGPEEKATAEPGRPAGAPTPRA
jgi:hypothetical protein